MPNQDRRQHRLTKSGVRGGGQSKKCPPSPRATKSMTDMIFLVVLCITCTTLVVFRFFLEWFIVVFHFNLDNYSMCRFFGSTILTCAILVLRVVRGFAVSLTRTTLARIYGSITVQIYSFIKFEYFNCTTF